MKKIGGAINMQQM